MGVAPDDWRRRGQQNYLLGVTLTRKNYQALSGQWEHEHCDFCFRTFVDPNYSDALRRLLETNPDEHASAGYTNLAADGLPAGKYWICEDCFEDFNDEFRWKVEATDPDAWPYQSAAPAHRQTAADFTPHGRILKRPE